MEFISCFQFRIIFRDFCAVELDAGLWVSTAIHGQFKYLHVINETRLHNAIAHYFQGRLSASSHCSILADNRKRQPTFLKFMLKVYLQIKPRWKSTPCFD